LGRITKCAPEPLFGVPFAAIFGAEVYREAPYQLSAVFDWLCQFGRKSLDFLGLQILPIGAEPSFSTSVCQLTLAAYAK
jgi:hypothetical protein